MFENFVLLPAHLLQSLERLGTNLLITHIRKTQKRVTTATKLQALARGKRTRQKRQDKAATKLHVQEQVRGKRDKRATIVKKHGAEPDVLGILFELFHVCFLLLHDFGQQLVRVVFVDGTQRQHLVFLIVGCYW